MADRMVHGRTVSTNSVVEYSRPSFLNFLDKAQWGYALFDAGCWGYASVTISTLAPIIFVRRVRESNGGSANEGGMPMDASSAIANAGKALSFDPRNLTDIEVVEEEVMNSLKLGDASGSWVFMVAISTLIAGILCPILGALADRYSARKLITYTTSALSIVFLTMFAFESRSSDAREILLVIGIAMTLTSIMHCFYNSLIMFLSGREDMVKVACFQCFIGNVGSAILMVALGMSDMQHRELTRDYIIFCFVVSAIWFVLLAIPMWIWLKEEDDDTYPAGTSLSDSLVLSWKETLVTLQNIEMMKFLVGLMLFNDANSTLHAVYLVYGAQIGLPVHALVLGAVFYKVLGAVAALAWLGLAQYAEAKICFMACIVLTIISIIMCAWMSNVADFFFVIISMTTAGSGAFIFSKVLMGSLTPKEKASHNFGFMGMMNRVAGFFGPLLFATLTFAYDEKAGFIGLVVMSIAGLFVLSYVDFEKGLQYAEGLHELAEDEEKVV